MALGDILIAGNHPFEEELSFFLKMWRKALTNMIALSIKQICTEMDAPVSDLCVSSGYLYNASEMQDLLVDVSLTMQVLSALDSKAHQEI